MKMENNVVQIKCQVCGQLVEDKDFHSTKIQEKQLCGHKGCLEKKLVELGLNESIESIPKKTNILFE